MKALSIDSNTSEVKEIEIEMQANTVYTFFNSILIDELGTIAEHVIYADSNALAERKRAYFIGEQLIVGDALVIGKLDFEDKDATIPKEELKALIDVNVSSFYKDVLEILAETDLNLYRTFILKRGEEEMTLNSEWVLYAFNMADDKTKEYFVTHLRKLVDSQESVEEYMYKMAGLAINAGASS